jgi:von Hippel-Lindau disease tumor supressor
MSMLRLFATVALMTTLTTLTACDGTVPGSPDPNPSASPSSSTVTGSVDVKLPDPTDIATFTGFKALSCDQEANLKSSTGVASNIVVNNKTDATIKLYWLNHQGERKEYSPGGIKAGATYRQGTFVTHPWVITNANEECLGIYVPESPNNAVLNVNKTVEVVGSGSLSGGTGGISGGVATDLTAGITRQQFINLMQCYKQKLPAAATLSIDVVLANINSIPDSAFTGANFAVQIQQARAAGCTI